MKIMTIRWPGSLCRVLVDDNGDFPEADRLDTHEARLSYLYPHPVNRLVRNIPNADHPRFALAVAALADVFLVAGIRRADVFWAAPETASKAAYTAVEKRLGRIWAREAQNAAESFDALGHPTRAHEVVEAALRALPPLRSFASVRTGRRSL